MACRESDSTLGTAHRSFSVGLKSTASNQLSNQRLWNCIRYIFYCQSSFSLLVKLQELQGRSFLSDLGVPCLVLNRRVSINVILSNNNDWCCCSLFLSQLGAPGYGISEVDQTTRCVVFAMSRLNVNRLIFFLKEIYYLLLNLTKSF